MMLDPRAELEGELELLADEAYCADVRGIARDLVSLALPPEDISTTECAERYRFMRAREGKGKRRWLLSLTPYVGGIQDALDDPRYKFVVVVGPGRAGKSVGGENKLFKNLRQGPQVDTIIYLQADSDVDSYADKEFRDFFELHDEIKRQVGTGPSDNKRELKKVAGRTIQLLPANENNIRQKEASFIIATEVDGYRPKVLDGFKDNIATRLQAAGSQGKAYIESHPDKGWNGPTVSAYQDSTRGLWYWHCPRCEQVSCPHPLAPPGLHMELVYDLQESLPEDELLDLVEQSAALKCPHCLALLGDDDKPAMLATGFWVFSGEEVMPDGTVTGERRRSESCGFWIHGAMSPFIKLGEMARKYVAAFRYFKRTRRPRRLKEVVVKTYGLCYDGAGSGSAAVSEERLSRRAAAATETDGFALGTVPDEVLFLTAAVDVGGSKFDVMICGWDIEGRCWIIDRFTLAQRAVKGRLQDIRPAERQDDWLVVRDEVLNRTVPLASNPGMRMPIAAVAVDTGGVGFKDREGVQSGVTWKAREFARRMARAGHYWGKPDNPWHKIRLIKGAKSPQAAELPAKGREVSVDEVGRKVKPTVLEWDLGVHKLKTHSVERLAEEEDGPGFVRFANDLPQSLFAEFAGEVLIDGAWERRGPNEGLDLLGYNEAARLMLRPDRAGIRWYDDEDGPARRPVWARPVPITKQEHQEQSVAGSPQPKKQSALDRMAALNRRR